VGFQTRSILKVDAATGAVVWEEKVGGAASSTVTISGDTAVFCGGKDTYAFKLTPQKGELLWKTPMVGWPGSHDRACSILIFRDLAYFNTGWNGFLRCLDLKTGVVKWEVKNEVHYSSPIAADGKIIMPEGHKDRNYYVLLKSTPEKYEELGNFGRDPKNGIQHTGGAGCTTPTLANGKLYIRGMDCIACYDLTEAGNK
jgi:outer membrane protein assembly factor BamB